MASTLDGITVLDLTQGPAGAYATMFLSDHGARVIRVVDTKDSTSRHGGYLVWDRGKECVRLDLTQIQSSTPRSLSSPADGQAALQNATATYERLVRSADVLVDDFAPASDRQAMVDFNWLSGLNARLIACSITAYGKHGPLKDEPPIDDLVMARMGIVGSQPGFRPPPVHVVHPLPSVGAALFANLGIAASLLAREKTGLGRKVETSLMAGALLYHPKVIGEHLVSRPFQTHPAGSAPFYSVYECADGSWVQLGCVHEGFIDIAAGLMGIKDVLEDPKFGRGRLPQTQEADLELREIVGNVIRTRPYAEWAKSFEASDVPFARARLTEESMDDPQVEANEMVVELQAAGKLAGQARFWCSAGSSRSRTLVALHLRQALRSPSRTTEPWIRECSSSRRTWRSRERSTRARWVATTVTEPFSPRNSVAMAERRSSRPKLRSRVKRLVIGQRERIAFPSSPYLWTRVTTKATCSCSSSAICTSGSAEEKGRRTSCRPITSASSSAITEVARSGSNRAPPVRPAQRCTL